MAAEEKEEAETATRGATRGSTRSAKAEAAARRRREVRANMEESGAELLQHFNHRYVTP